MEISEYQKIVGCVIWFAVLNLIAQFLLCWITNRHIDDVAKPKSRPTPPTE